MENMNDNEIEDNSSNEFLESLIADKKIYKTRMFNDYISIMTDYQFLIKNKENQVAIHQYFRKYKRISNLITVLKLKSMKLTEGSKIALKWIIEQNRFDVGATNEKTYIDIYKVLLYKKENVEMLCFELLKLPKSENKLDILLSSKKHFNFHYKEEYKNEVETLISMVERNRFHNNDYFPALQTIWTDLEELKVAYATFKISLVECHINTWLYWFAGKPCDIKYEIPIKWIHKNGKKTSLSYFIEKISKSQNTDFAKARKIFSPKIYKHNKHEYSCIDIDHLIDKLPTTKKTD